MQPGPRAENMEAKMWKHEFQSEPMLAGRSDYPQGTALDSPEFPLSHPLWPATTTTTKRWTKTTSTTVTKVTTVTRADRSGGSACSAGDWRPWAWAWGS